MNTILLNNYNILLIENNTDESKLLIRTLSTYFKNVFHAKNNTDGLNIFKKVGIDPNTRIDIIISTYYEDEEYNSYSLIKDIKNNYIHTKFILYSELLDKNLFKDLEKHGADYVHIKPIFEEELLKNSIHLIEIKNSETKEKSIKNEKKITSFLEENIPVALVSKEGIILDLNESYRKTFNLNKGDYEKNYFKDNFINKLIFNQLENNNIYEIKNFKNKNNFYANIIGIKDEYNYLFQSIIIYLKSDNIYQLEKKYLNKIEELLNKIDSQKKYILNLEKKAILIDKLESNKDRIDFLEDTLDFKIEDNLFFKNQIRFLELKIEKLESDKDKYLVELPLALKYYKKEYEKLKKTLIEYKSKNSTHDNILKTKEMNILNLEGDLNFSNLKIKELEKELIELKKQNKNLYEELLKNRK